MDETERLYAAYKHLVQARSLLQGSIILPGCESPVRGSELAGEQVQDALESVAWRYKRMLQGK